MPSFSLLTDLAPSTTSASAASRKNGRRSQIQNFDKALEASRQATRNVERPTQKKYERLPPVPVNEKDKPRIAIETTPPRSPVSERPQDAASANPQRSVQPADKAAAPETAKIDKAPTTEASGEPEGDAKDSTKTAATEPADKATTKTALSPEETALAAQIAAAVAANLAAANPSILDTSVAAATLASAAPQAQASVPGTIVADTAVAGIAATDAKAAAKQATAVAANAGETEETAAPATATIAAANSGNANAQNTASQDNASQNPDAKERGQEQASTLSLAIAKAAAPDEKPAAQANGAIAATEKADDTIKLAAKAETQPQAISAAARDFANAAEAAKAPATPEPVAVPTIQAISSLDPSSPAKPTDPAQAAARADAPVPLHAVAIEIGIRAARGAREFAIRLDPEDLGRIDIKLEISKEGQVQAKLSVERVETLQLLQRDAKTLERAFDQAGLKTNPDGLQFSLRDPGQQGRQNNAQDEPTNRRGFSAKDADVASIDEIKLRPAIYRSSANGGLDIRI